MAQQADEKPSSPATNMLSHALVAAAAAGFAVWVHGALTRGPAAETKAPAEQGEQAESDGGGAAQPGDAAAAMAGAGAGGDREDDSDAHPDPAAEANDGADGGPAPQSPLRIVADPAQLRVWHNTRVTLRAEPAQGRAFVRYVWHFEDGSDPEEGEVVAHVFPESVGDRHVTLEGYDEAGEKLVVSRTLPIERLPIAPLDDAELPVQRLPKPRGPRWVLGGAQQAGSITGVAAAAVRLAARVDGVVGVLIAGPAAVPESAVADTTVPVLSLRAGVTDVAAGPVLTVAADPHEGARKLISGTAEVLVVGGTALVAYNSLVEEHDEAAVQRAFRAMGAASAYDVTLLVSPRPLSALVDGDQVAIAAFRLYEQALRVKVKAVLSATSAVAFDGRYGGLEAIAIGAFDKGACRRLKGHDACQSATITLLELPRRGRAKAWHLRGPALTTWLSGAELPAVVGKYRR